MVIDREATARALEVAAEIIPRPSVEVPLLPIGLENKSNANSRSRRAESQRPRPLPIETEEPVTERGHEPATLPGDDDSTRETRPYRRRSRSLL